MNGQDMRGLQKTYRKASLPFWFAGKEEIRRLQKKCQTCFSDAHGITQSKKDLSDSLVFGPGC